MSTFACDIFWHLSHGRPAGRWPRHGVVYHTSGEVGPPERGSADDDAELLRVDRSSLAVTCESAMWREGRLAMRGAFAVDQAEGGGADASHVLLGGRQGGVRADAVPGAWPAVRWSSAPGVPVRSGSPVMDAGVVSRRM